MSKRDTQFQGFAKLLWEEIGKMEDAFCEECGTGPSSLAHDMNRAQEIDQSIQQTIARRAYDLALHVGTHIDFDYEYESCDVDKIPDMTELPKEQES